MTTPRRKREAAQAYHLRSYATLGYRARTLYQNAKSRAAASGAPFGLTRAWVEEQLLSGRCAVTGLPFDTTSSGRGKGHQHPWAPSLDRIVPHLGYTQENTRAVVWMFNAARHVGSDQDVMQFAEALCTTAPR